MSGVDAPLPDKQRPIFWWIYRKTGETFGGIPVESFKACKNVWSLIEFIHGDVCWIEYKVFPTEVIR